MRVRHSTRECDRNHHSGLAIQLIVYVEVPMVETSLGQQYLKAALAKWREANPWASDIPWERMPSRYKNEIEQTAIWAIAKSNPVSRAEDVVREIEYDDPAA